MLTVGANGRVYLNGAEIVEPTVLVPAAKYKQGRTAFFSMPANSVAFWVFTGASIPECASVEPISFEAEQTQQCTSSELLLQKLIVESVQRDENGTQRNDKNAIKRSKRSAENTIDRIRRDTENSIDKHGEYNAIEMRQVNDEQQTRDKRFIDDEKSRNAMENRGAYANKVALPGKRTKRDISMLKNLFDKFDLKKPAFNFKKPTLKFGNGLVPSISTVHDVFKAEPMEKKLFDQIENPELPTGDVHFELAEAVTEPNEYAAALNAANKFVEQPPALDPYSNAGFAAPVMRPSLTNAVPSSVLLGELTEMDVKSEIATIAPAPMPLQIPQPTMAQTVQPVQPAPAMQHNLQYIVKNLEPTYQMNRENMEKVRNNLRQNRWPMATNAHIVSPKTINAYLPNIAVQGGQPQEHILFESKRRRRRAISSKMNEEIERRVQRHAAKPTHDLRLDEAIDQIDLLDKMLQLVDKLERSQNSLLKNDDGIKSFPSQTTEESSAPKKCKVLSMAMEQQCLQTETRPKALFKRAIEHRRTKPNGPLRKFLAKIKDTVEKPLKYRHKRSVYHNEIDSEENEVNGIAKEFNDYVPNRKNVYSARLYERQFTATTTPKPATTTPEPTTESHRWLTTPPPAPTTQRTSSTTAMTTTTEKTVPKVLKAIKGYANKITNSVAKHIGRFWLALS